MTEVRELRDRQGQPPVSDFWFARVDLRLSRIETLLGRLERQVWLMLCAVLALSGAAGLRALVAG